jgi:tetratricopeptide (TPR) repeat protein
VAGKLNRKRAAALLDQAQLHRQRQEWTRVEEVLAPVVAEPDVAPAEAFGVLSDALRQLHRLDDAHLALEHGLAAHRDDPTLLARLGSLLVDLARPEEGLKHLERARKMLGRDPAYLTHLGFAQLRAGKTDLAMQTGEAALQKGGQDEARLLLAAVKGRQGDYAQAQAMALALEERAKDPDIRAAASSVRADAMLFSGDGKGALGLWKALETNGKLEPAMLGHMAYAAQLAGEATLADELIARRSEQQPTAEDRLLFAQIFNVRNEPAAALEQLASAEAGTAEHYTGFDYEAAATRGRALRMLGRSDEAREVLDAAAARPEYMLPRAGARVRIDRAHLLAEGGDFDQAATLFREALTLDPGDPEATRALELTAQKIAWKHALTASTEARVEAARADTEALERRFRSREAELHALRRELERVKAAQARAEEEKDRVQKEAQAALEREKAAHQQKLAEELAMRELDVEQKADEAIDRALDGVKARCPDVLVKLLRVAERTFQKALYTELPAAAVAVLYSGALERGLYMLFVERFEKWLDEKGRREAFLTGAIRERRGKRVDYWDFFVEAFDHAVTGKAPSMGEVGRALSKRTEPYMKPFRDFLAQSYAVPDAFYDGLAEFVQWSKEKLRDPAAHGRGIELGYEELKRFREELLFNFRGSGRGALARLLAPKE